MLYVKLIDMKLDELNDLVIIKGVSYKLSEIVNSLNAVGINKTSTLFNISRYILSNINSKYCLVKYNKYSSKNYDSEGLITEHGEKITKDIIYNLYMVENLTKKEISEKLHITRTQVIHLIKMFDIQKSWELRSQAQTRLYIDKYGSKSNNNLEKARKTCLERYGVDNAFKAKEKQEKIKNTLLERYGVEQPCQSKEINDKVTKTMLVRYGVTRYTQLPEGKAKVRATCLERYGVTAPMKCPSIKEKHDFENWAKKVFETKINNGTTNTSKPQEILYSNLIDIFGKNDIVREYKDERYPFHADFYVKSLDLFIELNIFFTHGGEPYNPNCEKHKIRLNKFKEKSKTSIFYQNAIKVWT